MNPISFHCYDCDALPRWCCRDVVGHAMGGIYHYSRLYQAAEMAKKIQEDAK